MEVLCHKFIHLHVTSIRNRKILKKGDRKNDRNSFDEVKVNALNIIINNKINNIIVVLLFGSPDTSISNKLVNTTQVQLCHIKEYIKPFFCLIDASHLIETILT